MDYGSVLAMQAYGAVPPRFRRRRYSRRVLIARLRKKISILEAKKARTIQPGTKAKISRRIAVLRAKLARLQAPGRARWAVRHAAGTRRMPWWKRRAYLHRRRWRRGKIFPLPASQYTQPDAWAPKDTYSPVESVPDDAIAEGDSEEPMDMDLYEDEGGGLFGFDTGTLLKWGGIAVAGLFALKYLGKRSRGSSSKKRSAGRPAPRVASAPPVAVGE